MASPDLSLRLESALGALRPRAPRRLLLAVSGGADSMALLEAAALWAKASGAFLAVGHVDHGLRGRASTADAAFVRRAAARHGLAFRLARAPVRAFARREGRGLEESARLLRYRTLAAMARALRCGGVVTAHTLNDQAETVVMNLIRGAGPDGMGGMAPASAWPFPGVRGLRLIRPFLGTRRADILDFLRSRRAPFRTDATNAQPLFFRNRVRPVLASWERERPGLAERLGRLAELMRDEESFWEEALGPRRKHLELTPFKSYHKAFQRRLLRRTFGFSSFTAIERARAFALDPGPARRQSIPGGWVEKTRGVLSFRPLKLSTPAGRYE